MMSGLLIRGGTIVNEAESYRGLDRRRGRTHRADRTGRLSPSRVRRRDDRRGRNVRAARRDRRPSALPRAGLTYKGDRTANDRGGGGRSDLLHGHAQRQAAHRNERSAGRKARTCGRNLGGQLLVLPRRDERQYRADPSPRPRSGSAASSSSWARRPATCSSTTSVRSAPCSPSRPCRSPRTARTSRPYGPTWNASERCTASRA